MCNSIICDGEPPWHWQPPSYGVVHVYLLPVVYGDYLYLTEINADISLLYKKHARILANFSTSKFKYAPEYFKGLYRNDRKSKETSRVTGESDDHRSHFYWKWYYTRS